MSARRWAMFAAPFIGGYLFMAFATWDFDPENWGVLGRSLPLFCALWIAGALVIFGDDL